MKLIIGSDHAGFEVKEKLKQMLNNHDITDAGTGSADSVDYPDIAAEVTEKVISDKALGILICGTGLGMCMASNRNPKIRAALAYSVETAKLSRTHNDANVLCLGARTMKFDMIKEIVKVWLETPFSGEERHARRIKKMEDG
ncbi:MAG: ribose 5-phosphate isomerase B [Nanoarchaeota archaeon]|nr:ribose 5-phosphate isomerase B [Nanoarchaeota archaeon]